MGADTLQRVAKPFCDDCPDLCDEEFAEDYDDVIEGLEENDYNLLMQQILFHS